MDVKDRLLARRKIDPGTGCWEWLGTPDKYGYGLIQVGGKRRKVHRLAYEVFVGPISEGLEILHSCDNPKCFNPEHLRAGTHADNMTDMSIKQRNRVPHPNVRGEKCWRHALTWDQVREIRSLAGKISQRELGRMFGICQTQVSHIVRGEQWKDTV